MSDNDFKDFFKKQIDAVIKQVVPPSEPEFRQEMELVFSPDFVDESEIFKNEMEANIEDLDFYILGVDSNNVLVERANKAINESHRFSSSKYVEYFHNIQFLLRTYLLESKELSPQNKLKIIQVDLDFIKKHLGIRKPNKLEKKMIKYYESEIEKLSKQVKNAMDTLKSRCLFDGDVIIRLDQLLRPYYILKDEQDLLSILDKDAWENNTPTIIWQRDKYELLYLFYLLNSGKNSILHGSIEALISKSFLFKDQKTADYNNLKKLYSNYLLDFAKHNPTKEGLKEIKELFNLAVR